MVVILADHGLRLDLNGFDIGTICNGVGQTDALALYLHGVLRKAGLVH